MGLGTLGGRAILAVLATGWAAAACRGPAPVRVVPAPVARATPDAVRAAVRAANLEPGDARWTIEQTLELSGLPVEQYRLGGGPALLLIPDDFGTAAVVQVWLPFGWGDEPAGARGRLRRWAHGWPRAPLGARTPTRAWAGVARDLSGASWTVAADDLPRLVTRVAGAWPTRTSTPALARAEALELRMRRTFWEAVDAAGADRGPPVEAHRALWVVAGRLDRARVLRAFRAAHDAAMRPRPEPIRRRAPGPGPRIPLEVSGPDEPRPALVGWPWSPTSPAALVRLRALAILLTRGPQARLRDLDAQGAELFVESGPRGASLEAWLRLGPTASATVAAARIRNAIAEIGQGRTTGIELERLGHELEAERLSGWARLESRAAMAAEAALLFGDVSALATRWRAEQRLDEPALRALAKTLAGRHPVIVQGRSP